MSPVRSRDRFIKMYNFYSKNSRCYKINVVRLAFDRDLLLTG